MRILQIIIEAQIAFSLIDRQRVLSAEHHPSLKVEQTAAQVSEIRKTVSSQKIDGQFRSSQLCLTATLYSRN